MKIFTPNTTIFCYYMTYDSDFLLIETYRDYEQTEVNVRGTVTQLQQNVISTQQREKVIETLRVLGR